MPDSDIAVVLVGYGFAGKTFHAPFLETTTGLRLSAVVSTRPGTVRRDLPQVRVLSLDEALADRSIELVVVATPNDTHAGIARRALDSGKHAVVDKPFTTTVAEAESLAEVAARTGRVLSVFQNRRWDADFLTLRQVVAHAGLGGMVHFESRYDRYRPEVVKRWRELPGAGTGIWFDLGSHLADQALQLFGEPDAVYADLAAQRKGGVAPDYFHVLLRYSRLRVVLHGSNLVAEPSPRFTLHGDAGSYVKFGLDTQEAALRRGERPGGGDWGVDPLEGMVWHGGSSEPQGFPNARGDYGAYYRGLRTAIRGGGPNPVPAEQGIAVMKMLELAAKSAEQGRELPFPKSQS